MSHTVTRYINQSTHDTIFVTVTHTSSNTVIVKINSYVSTEYGDALTLFNVLNGISIVLSVFTMAAVITLYFVRKPVAKRPSIRLSGWIGAADFLTSLMFILQGSYSFMSARNQASIRIIGWINSLGPVAFIFLSSAIALHLQLTVIMKKDSLAQRLDPFYELISIGLAILFTHPNLYVKRQVVWDPYKQVNHVGDYAFSKKAIFWLFDVLWELLGIVYCFIISVILIFRLWPLWSRMYSTDLHMPEGTVSSSNHRSNEGTATSSDQRPSTATYVPGGYYSPVLEQGTPLRTASPLRSANYPRMNVSNQLLNQNGANNVISFVTKSHHEKVKRMIQRILLYPIVPIITRTLTLADLFITGNTPGLSATARSLAALQGTLNFTIFLLNPGMDDVWSCIAKKIFRKNKPEKQLDPTASSPANTIKPQPASAFLFPTTFSPNRGSSYSFSPLNTERSSPQQKLISPHIQQLEYRPSFSDPHPNEQIKSKLAKGRLRSTTSPGSLSSESSLSNSSSEMSDPKHSAQYHRNNANEAIDIVDNTGGFEIASSGYQTPNPKTRTQSKQQQHCQPNELFGRSFTNMFDKKLFDPKD
ncbi:hypothetical protein H4219_002877 [Mycoemilia scoparia]|uniref:Uncharacterized protein n=1 Tax=Mycoemilia scoparia TaxID=417184 RepID=A0A9W7ZWD7_9FUNG|nr:hypothetical protein H4219_002877 [Mycoemilia scoparia]